MSSPFDLQCLPDPSAVEAAVSLLADPDPKVARACLAQVLQWGEPVRPTLMRALCEDDPRLRIRARAALRVLDLRVWGGEVFGLLKTERKDDGLLLRGCALLGAAGGSRMTAAELQDWVRDLGDRLRPRIRGRKSRTAGKLLASLMSEEEGFQGEQACFFDQGSVEVESVLERRQGMPVSLSILYLLVGRQAGLSMAGVGMPNHFLVRIHGPRPMLLDPFHGGRAVTKADCIRYLRVAGYGSSATDHLRDLHDREALLSLARTLLRAYQNRRDRAFCEVLERTLECLG